MPHPYYRYERRVKDIVANGGLQLEQEMRQTFRVLSDYTPAKTRASIAYEENNRRVLLNADLALSNTLEFSSISGTVIRRELTRGTTEILECEDGMPGVWSGFSTNSDAVRLLAELPQVKKSGTLDKSPVTDYDLWNAVVPRNIEHDKTLRESSVEYLKTLDELYTGMYSTIVLRRRIRNSSQPWPNHPQSILALEETTTLRMPDGNYMSEKHVTSLDQKSGEMSASSFFTPNARDPLSPPAILCENFDRKSFVSRQLSALERLEQSYRFD